MHILETTVWRIYNNKTYKLLNLTSEDFARLLKNSPVKLTGKYMTLTGNKSIWVDAEINRA